MLRIVFGLNQIMLRRHQGLVLDHCIARMSTDTNIEIHKYLDHCENEHKEENALGLHGASDQCGTPSLTTH